MKKYLQGMKVYSVGEASVSGHETVINLASNERTSSPAPAIQQALLASCYEANRYADNACRALIDTLARAHEIPAENILCGNGSAELIFLLAEAFAAETDEVIMWKHGYLLYETAVQRTGATIVRPQTAAFVDAEALLALVTENTRLVYLDNPNNPTGDYLSLDQLRKLRMQLRSDILLVIDAAYAEYAVAADYTDGKTLVTEFANVCMLRSFSKYYGLAGARLGWMYGSRDLIAALKAIQQPSSVSLAAQCAAVVALREISKTMLRRENHSLREAFSASLQALGLKVYPSQANFLLVDFFSAENALQIFAALKQDGIIVRPMRPYQLPSCLRITIGAPAEMEAVIKSLIKALDSIRISIIAPHHNPVLN